MADVPDPLPLRSIPVPLEVTQVVGCNCGGLEFHRWSASDEDPHGPACSIWSLPPEEAKENIVAALGRVAAFTDALTVKLRAQLSKTRGEHGGQVHD